MIGASVTGKNAEQVRLECAYPSTTPHNGLDAEKKAHSLLLDVHANKWSSLCSGRVLTDLRNQLITEHWRKVFS
ncbi:MAG: hypothetical protein Rhob2KO_42350 [Rhodopirellula baltica]